MYIREKTHICKSAYGMDMAFLSLIKQLLTTLVTSENILK